jgi:ParB family chromosome partitioning protein
MARKNIFDNLMRAGASDELEPDEPTAGLRKFGAAKSISSSIDELAKQASKLVEGETVVLIDPELIDGSFVSDRMNSDDEAYQELLSAIRDRGQETPVLLRPHPETEGRYQIVFGHRRVKVAHELCRPVRAVVKALADIDHIIAQGQENSARANLTFIERVLFAQRLLDLGYTREIIQSALSVDYQTLSKMLTIPKAIPEEVINAMGPAKGVGRDRWLELRKLIENPKNTATAMAYVAGEEFSVAESDDRFNLLFNLLSGARPKRAVRKAITPKNGRSWTPEDKSVTATIKASGNAFNLALRSKDAGRFGDFISENLDSLYRAFRESEKTETGDRS